MADAATKEEVQQLRSSIDALTMMTFALLRRSITHGHITAQEVENMIADLRVSIGDQDLRATWAHEIDDTRRLIKSFNGISGPENNSSG